jgi:hypothetical protein
MPRQIHLANGESIIFDESHDVHGQPLLLALVRKDVGVVRLVRKPDIVAEEEHDGEVTSPSPVREGRRDEGV